MSCDLMMFTFNILLIFKLHILLHTSSHALSAVCATSHTGDLATNNKRILVYANAQTFIQHTTTTTDPFCRIFNSVYSLFLSLANV